MRKEADFEVMDRIRVTYDRNRKGRSRICEEHAAQIGGEVLGRRGRKSSSRPAYVKEWKINGEAVTMGVEKEGK